MTIQDKLYEKVSAEYNAFIKGIENMPAAEAIDKHAYEKVIKEDMVSCLESCEMPNGEAKALFKLKDPLDSMYREWLDNDCSHMDMIRDTISHFAQKEIWLNIRDNTR